MVIIHATNPAPGDMEWSADGENTDCSTTSSPPTTVPRRLHQNNQEHDSLSDEDDLSDEFSLIDSDEEKRAEARYSQHQLLQVGRERGFRKQAKMGVSGASRVFVAGHCEEDVLEQQGEVQAAERQRGLRRAEEAGAHTSA